MTTDRSHPYSAQTTLLGHVRLNGREVSGFVLDLADPAREFVVELVLDDWPVKLARADLLDQVLASHEDASLRESPFHGFVFNVPEALLTPGSALAVRVANTGELIDEVVSIAATKPTEPSGGVIRWVGGLRFEGWLATTHDDDDVRCLIEEDVVGRFIPSGWTFAQIGDEAKPKHKLDVHLPERLADGRLHTAHFIDSRGTPLNGSPIAFFAFPDGLARFVAGAADLDSERVRLDVIDRLLPQSLPFSHVRDWIDRFPYPLPLERQEVAVALIGEQDIETSLASLDGSASPWVLGAITGDAKDGTFDREAFGDFIDGLDQTIETVVVALSGTAFLPGALTILAAAMAPGDHAVYGDLLCRDDEALETPIAFPQVDYERILEQGYAAFCFAIRREVALECLTRSRPDSVYRLFNSLFDTDRRAAVRHVPAFLAVRPPLDGTRASAALGVATKQHLEARHVKADVSMGAGSLFPAVHVRRWLSSEPVTAIIAAHGRPGDLQATVKSLRQVSTRHPLEIMIVARRAGDPALDETLASYETREIDVLRLPSTSTSLAASFQAGVMRCSRRFVALLGAGVTLEDGLWFDELMARCQEEDVAAAGGTLVVRDQVVNAGFVLDPQLGASAIAAGHSNEDPGYGDLMRVAASRSVLSTQAVMLRREDFIAVGGFRMALFPRVFFGLDYGLRLAQQGRRLVVSPHVQAQVPIGSAPPREEAHSIRRAAFERELAQLRLCWGASLPNDPFYSPSLSLNGCSFGALAWPPRRGA